MLCSSANRIDLHKIIFNLNMNADFGKYKKRGVVSRANY